MNNNEKFRSLQAQKIGLMAYKEMLEGMSRRMEELDEIDLSLWTTHHAMQIQRVMNVIEIKKRALTGAGNSNSSTTHTTPQVYQK